MFKKAPDKMVKPAAPMGTKPPAPKKKLSLDIGDVSEVLERKISPQLL